MVVLILLNTTMTTSFAKDNDFIQTFAVRVGGDSLSSKEKEALTHFDMIMCNRFHYDDINGNTWEYIKKKNPNTEIYLYQAGWSVSDNTDDSAIKYLNNIGRWKISRNHSMGSIYLDNPDLILLDSSGNHIYNPATAYTFQKILDIGSSKYQNYWLEATINDITNQPWKADGVFMDNCLTTKDSLESDPVKYPTNNEWIPAMNRFVSETAKGIHQENQKTWVNRGYTRFENGSHAWIALDNLAEAPNAALEEGAFAVKYGKNDVQFFPESHWKNQVDLMNNIHNYKVTYLSHSDLSKDESGLDNYEKLVTFWDILWYTMNSYLIAKNEIDNNSYFSFSESYNLVTWYDEFDSMNGGNLDLGEAVGTYNISKYGGHNIYWREFEKGYVYVNPTGSDVSSINLPETCKQLTHNNFKNDSSTISDVSDINLKSHRATILLKENMPSTVTFTCLKTNTPITIDGNLDSVWSEANYVTFLNPAKSDNQVKVYSLYSDDNLYFAFDITDSNLEAINGDLWKDDGAEIFLDTQNNKLDALDSNDYHFLTNINDISSGGIIATKTTTKPNGYITEIAIPKTTLNTTFTVDKIMGLLLANNDRDNSILKQFDWLNLIESGSYSKPNLWGEIILSSQTTNQQPILGDLNNDGLVNDQDILSCINHILGTYNYGTRADINNDGKIDILDVMSIVKIVLGV